MKPTAKVWLPAGTLTAFEYTCGEAATASTSKVATVCPSMRKTIRVGSGPACIPHARAESVCSPDCSNLTVALRVPFEYRFQAVPAAAPVDAVAASASTRIATASEWSRAHASSTSRSAAASYFSISSGARLSTSALLS